MPRVSREQMEANRATIEDVSARLFREQGIAGVSVADLMSAAGLTHGGFYGHFASKDELAAVACEHAFAKAAQSREKRTKQTGSGVDGAASLKNYADHYLTSRHRDNAGQGCPAVAFATDVMRETTDKPVRDAYLSGIKNMAKALETMAGAGAQTQREQALVAMATVVGAMTLARATKGDPLSDELLAAVRGFFAHQNAD